ncbi:MAG: TRAP transporter large permease [Alphaproteobacteria bacterium]|nr:TRAP transporter large permease [Alphaproteobacteria bacterium]
MSGTLLAIVMFALMLVLMAVRVPVALAMFLVGSAGYLSIMGLAPYLSYLKSTPYFLLSNYSLSVIPLFILMGALAEQSGISRSLFTAANALIGHRRGGVAMATIGACTLFGAICGSSVATTATMGRVALPEMLRLGYAPGFATGTLAVGGTLGILIPPSVVLVVYAITTEQNIAKLFMAALIPGLLASLFYQCTIVYLVRRNPEKAPAGPRSTGGERRTAVMQVWPAVVIAMAVVGGIYGGIFTPTEGAAVGVAATLAVALTQGRMGWPALRTSLVQTAETSAMIFAILLGADVFNAFLALSKMPETVAEAIVATGLPPYAIVSCLMLFYILLGSVMDELAMILLTLPVFFPVVMALDFGLPPEETAIWFGILVLIVVGIGLTAPPVGLNVFVISGIARDVPMADTYRAVLPYLATDVTRLFLVVVFPSLALEFVRFLT